MEVELEIGRDPPVFDPRDDVMNLGCTLQQTREGGTSKPPLAPGSVLVANIGVNDLPVARVQWPELHYIDDSKGTILISYLNLAVPLNEFAAPETYNISLQVRTGPPYGDLTAWMLIQTEEATAELWAESYPSVPDSGPLSTMLHEAARSAGHWELLRSLLFSAPFLVSQQELLSLAQLSSTFYGRPNDHLLRLHFPPEAFPERYSSCAVVGSAGHLLGSRLGSVIDAHELVLRFNEAPTAGFEPDVGSRTTHRIVHAADPIRRFLQRRWAGVPGRELLLFFPTGAADLEDMLTFLELNNGGGVYLVSAAYVLFVRSVLGLRSTDKSPTSGFVGLTHALQVCDRVSTFGFGAYQPGRGAQCLGAVCGAERAESGSAPGRYRYFDSSDERPWAYGHGWSREEALHHQWEELGLLSRIFN